MKESSWFHILVLGGAAMVGACVEDEGSTEGSGATGPGTTQGPGPTTSVATNGSGGTTSAGGGNAQGGGDPVCSDPASPNDPCGCACCWVMDCLNTEECCTGWCGDCC
ncbi:MAG TPA: hypothetical protein VFB62_22680 [Polyangiaceae bacterium]|jgi:hypothetical protein|nr:hypothetical protein [Polyangiaceae bacterium]